MPCEALCRPSGSTREAAIDTHRRRALAAGLAMQEGQQQSSDWCGFLGLPEDAITEEAFGRESLPSEWLSLCIEATPRGPTALLGPIFAAASVEVTSSSSRPVQAAARVRPTKGPNRVTAAASKAAVDSIFGKVINLDHG